MSHVVAVDLLRPYVVERRARRVPGADHHEGQGGSQRRGTRRMMRYGSFPSARTFELVSPPAT